MDVIGNMMRSAGGEFLEARNVTELQARMPSNLLATQINRSLIAVQSNIRVALLQKIFRHTYREYRNTAKISDIPLDISQFELDLACLAKMDCAITTPESVELDEKGDEVAGVPNLILFLKKYTARFNLTLHDILFYLVNMYKRQKDCLPRKCLNVLLCSFKEADLPLEMKISNTYGQGIAVWSHNNRVNLVNDIINSGLGGSRFEQAFRYPNVDALVRDIEGCSFNVLEHKSNILSYVSITDNSRLTDTTFMRYCKTITFRDAYLLMKRAFMNKDFCDGDASPYVPPRVCRWDMLTLSAKLQAEKDPMTRVSYHELRDLCINFGISPSDLLSDNPTTNAVPSGTYVVPVPSGTTGGSFNRTTSEIQLVKSWICMDFISNSRMCAWFVVHHCYDKVLQSIAYNVPEEVMKFKMLLEYCVERDAAVPYDVTDEEARTGKATIPSLLLTLAYYGVRLGISLKDVLFYLLNVKYTFGPDFPLPFRCLRLVIFDLPGVLKSPLIDATMKDDLSHFAIVKRDEYQTANHKARAIEELKETLALEFKGTLYAKSGDLVLTYSNEVDIFTKLAQTRQQVFDCRIKSQSDPMDLSEASPMTEIMYYVRVIGKSRSELILKRAVEEKQQQSDLVAMKSRPRQWDTMTLEEHNSAEKSLYEHTTYAELRELYRRGINANTLLGFPPNYISIRKANIASTHHNTSVATMQPVLIDAIEYDLLDPFQETELPVKSGDKQPAVTTAPPVDSHERSSMRNDSGDSSRYPLRHESGTRNRSDSYYHHGRGRGDRHDYRGSYIDADSYYHHGRGRGDRHDYRGSYTYDGTRHCERHINQGDKYVDDHYINQRYEQRSDTRTYHNPNRGYNYGDSSRYPLRHESDTRNRSDSYYHHGRGRGDRYDYPGSRSNIVRIIDENPGWGPGYENKHMSSSSTAPPPVVDAPPPVVDVPAPVVDVPAPVVDVPAPVVDVPAPPRLLRKRDMPPDVNDSNLTEYGDEDDDDDEFFQYDKSASLIDIEKIRKEFPHSPVLHDWLDIRTDNRVKFATCIQAMTLPDHLKGKFPVHMPPLPIKEQNIWYDWSMWRAGPTLHTAVRKIYSGRKNIEKSSRDFNNKWLRKAEPLSKAWVEAENTSTWGAPREKEYLGQSAYEQISNQVNAVEGFLKTEKEKLYHVYTTGREIFAKRVASLHNYQEKNPQLRKKEKEDLYEYIRLFRPDFYMCHLADYNYPTENQFIEHGMNAEIEANKDLYDKYGKWVRLLEDENFDPHEMAKEMATSGDADEGNLIPDWVFSMYHNPDMCDKFMQRISDENENDEEGNLDEGVVDYAAQQREKASHWKGRTNNRDEDDDSATEE
jgi:hypothetical protein